MSSVNIHLLVIDPQIDFMDSPGSTLPVPGANSDMKRVSALIDRIGDKLEDIHVTLDSHRIIDVGNPGMWRNQNAEHPSPFSIISAEDIRQGSWSPRDPGLRQRMIAYAEKLEAQGNYPLIIWPEHCIIGTPGHNVQPDLMKSLTNWERRNFANVDYVAKGTNPFTEHYGALMAEVPDPTDPSTGLNTKLLDILSEADIILVAGEALSHCVKSTVSQIADNIGDEHIKKFHLLTDCSSPVPAIPGADFPVIAQAWLKEMQSRGMTLTTSTKVLT